MIDFSNVLVALIVATPGTLSALRSYQNGQKLDTVHQEINSRMDDAIAAAKKVGHAEGVEEERARPYSRKRKQK